MSARRKLTEAEREERRARDRERLKQAAQQLLTSQGWQHWVRVRSRNGLARYSLSNQLLIALGRPDATFVAGFKAWLELGYCVKKGEKAIRILAPVTVKERDLRTGEETGETRTFFRTVFVFDRAQVAPLPSGQPTPLEPPSEPLTGASHAHLLAPLSAFAESLGFAVGFESTPGSTGGWCDVKQRRIVVDAEAPANARLRTLIHETIHALGVGYAEYGRARAEVIVDTATYLASSSVGLDVAASRSRMWRAGARTARSRRPRSSQRRSTPWPGASRMPSPSSPSTRQAEAACCVAPAAGPVAIGAGTWNGAATRRRSAGFPRGCRIKPFEKTRGTLAEVHISAAVRDDLATDHPLAMGAMAVFAAQP